MRDYTKHPNNLLTAACPLCGKPMRPISKMCVDCRIATDKDRSRKKPDGNKRKGA